MKKFMLLMLLTAFVLALTACNFDNESSTESESDDSSSEQAGTESEAGTEEESSEEASSGEKVINLVETSEIPTIDSAHAHDGVALTVLNNVKEGLYRGDDTNNPQLAMAEDHQISEDGLVHTFTIREGATWSNGDPVTAHDFEFAWKRVFEVVGHYNVMFETASIKNASAILNEEATPDELGVKALDDKTLEVTLDNPNALLKQLLTFPVFFPQNQAFVEEQGERYGTEADSILANGPFVLDSWQHDQGWTYVKNENYWDAAQAGNVEQINVNVVKETSTAVNLWETDEVDRVLLSSSYVDQYQDDEAFAIVEQPSIVFMRFNHNLEQFQNEKIRKAIDMAIDKEGLTGTILNDGSLPLNSLVPRNFSFSPDGEDFRDLNGEFNEGTVEDAKALWEEGLSELGSDGFSYTLTVSDDESHQKAAEFIKNQLETNLEGLTVEIKTVPFAARLEQEKAVDYDMVISTWGPDYGDPMTFIDMWQTDGPANRMDYSNPDYDELVEQARVETDAAARYEILLEAEKTLMDELHIAPLYQDADAVLMRPNIKGMVQHPSAPEFEYKWINVE